MKKIFLVFTTIGLLSACSVENIIEVTPLMVTYEPGNVLTTSASMGGITMSEGGKPINEYGVVFATNENPTTTDNKVAVGERLGDYYINYEGLNPGTTYFYRAYGTNAVGTGYGETYSFTTQEEAPCNPVQENLVDLGYRDIIINDVEMVDPPFGATSQFETHTYNSSATIVMVFNEIEGRLPLTGTYHTDYEFDSQEPKSIGKVHMYVQDYGVQIGGANVPPGNEIYIENNNGEITFTICGIPINQFYNLSGKFTYSE